MITQKEARKQLVEALRSGEFEQGKSRLSRNDKFCCLGVACEVAIRNGVTIKRETAKEATKFDNYISYDDNLHSLPQSVMNFFGFTNEWGQHGPYPGKSLAELNDNGATFEDIAKIIEQEPEGLFTNETI